MQRLSLTLSVTIFILFSSLQAKSQTYMPDSTFNNTGFKQYTYYNNVDRNFGVVTLPDGRIVTCGLSKNTSTGYFELCIARLLANGSPDLTFHNTGDIRISQGLLGSIGGQTPKLLIQPDGKIVAGNTYYSAGQSQDMYVCRIDTNGFPDPSFHTYGFINVDMTGTNTYPDMVNALALDGSGNIYALGVTRNGTSPLNCDYAMLKITPTGQLDPSFNGNGKKLFNPSGAAEFGNGIAVQSDGKIVFAGDAGNYVYVMRIDSTGAYDASFNGSGHVQLNPGSGPTMTCLQLDSAGRILVGGDINNNSLFIARLRTNGIPDSSFHSNGFNTFTYGATDNAMGAIRIQPDQKILIGGNGLNSTFLSDFLVMRLDTTGSIDLSFNTTGYLKVHVTNTGVNERGNDMALMDDGRIVLTGTEEMSSAVNEDAALVRLKPVVSTTGLFEPVSPTNVKAGPNPFHDELYIVSRECENVTLVDVSGRTLAHFVLNAGFSTYATTDLSAGIYFLRTDSGSVIRLVKQ